MNGDDLESFWSEIRVAPLPRPPEPEPEPELDQTFWLGLLVAGDKEVLERAPARMWKGVGTEEGSLVFEAEFYSREYLSEPVQYFALWANQTGGTPLKVCTPDNRPIAIGPDDNLKLRFELKL